MPRLCLPFCIHTDRHLYYGFPSMYCLLFSWFVVGIVGDDMWGACGVEEQATDFYLKTRAGSTSKMPCAFQIQIRSSVQYTACVMSKQLYTLTDNEFMKGLDMCVYVCVYIYIYEKSVCFQECLFCVNHYTVTGMQKVVVGQCLRHVFHSYFDTLSRIAFSFIIIYLR